MNIEEKVKISDGIKEKYEKYCVSLIPFSIHFTIPFYLFFATFSPFLLFWYIKSTVPSFDEPTLLSEKKILLYNTIKFGTNNAIKLRLLQFAEDKNSNKLGLYACVRAPSPGQPQFFRWWREGVPMVK